MLKMFSWFLYVVCVYFPQVVVSDPSILEALPVESDPQSSSIFIYPIKLLDTVTLWERDQIDVWVNLVGQKTGQKVKVPVFIRLVGQKPEVSGNFCFGLLRMLQS